MTFLWLDGITDWVWANSKRTEGQGSLASCSPWDHKESHTTEWLNNNRFQDQYSILTHTADKKHNRGFTYPSSENLEKSFSSKAIINQKNSIFWISKFNQPGNLQQAQANRRAWKQPSVTCLPWIKTCLYNSFKVYSVVFVFSKQKPKRQKVLVVTKNMKLKEDICRMKDITNGSYALMNDHNGNKKWVIQIRVGKTAEDMFFFLNFILFLNFTILY